MKRNKLVAGIATIAMVTSMMGTLVMAEDWNTNGGTAEIQGVAVPMEPVIEVIIPEDVSFVVNPLRTVFDDGTETGSVKQIWAPNYEIINASNVPVVIEAKTKVTAGTSVDLLSAAVYDDNTFELKKSDGKKAAFMVLSVPKEVSVSGEVATYTIDSLDSSTPSTPATSASTVTDAGSAKAAAKAILSASDTTVNFSLSALTDKNWTDAKCASAFTIEGFVDPQSTFAAEDLKVTTVYKLNALTPNQAANGYEADDAFTGAHSSIVKAK